MIRRFAGTVLILAAPATAGAGYYAATHLGMNTSTVDMLSEELPFHRNFSVLDQAFPLEYRTIVVVVEADEAARAEDAAARLAAELAGDSAHFRSVFHPGGDPFFRRNGLLYLDVEALYSLADDLARAQPLLAALHADMSLRGLAELLIQALQGSTRARAQAPAVLEEALDDLAETVEGVVEGRAARFPWRSLIGEAQDGKLSAARQVMILEPLLDFGSLRPAGDAIAAVRRTVAALQLTPENGVRVRMTGQLLMQQDEMESVQEGIVFVGLLSFVLVLSLLMAGLRSSRLVAATLVTLLMGLVWTACFAALAIGKLNLISVTFGILFIGLSVDFGIHFALRYREAVDKGAEPAAALEQAGARVGGALLLSAVAAAIGFLSFLPTSYKGLSELGLIAGPGMFIALFANLTVLPAIMSLAPLRPAPLGDGEAGMSRLLGVVARRPRAVVAGALLLGLAAAVALPFARFDDNPLNLRDPDTESVATLLDLLEDPRLDPFKAATLAADEAAARRLKAALEALPEVEAAVSLLDLVPAAQDEKLEVLDEISLFMAPLLTPAAARVAPEPLEREDAIVRLKAALAHSGQNAAGARLALALEEFEKSGIDPALLEAALVGDLPDLLDGLGEALAAEGVALAELPAALVARKRTGDGRLLVEIYPAADLRDKRRREDFVTAVQLVAPRATGEAIIVTEAGKAVLGAFREAALYAGLAIFALLLVVLRSVLDAVLIMTPLALATLLTVAATVVLGSPLNFANVIVLPLLFGLGVAGGIHIVLRDRAGPPGGLARTYTPRAVIFSALTTIGSFGALALSSHPGTASMGVLLTIAICLATLCTVVVLPALRQVVRAAGPSSSQG